MDSDGKAIVALPEILSPWEKKFCEWMVEKAPASVKKTDQAKACTALAGREVTVKEIEKLRQRRAYRRYYTEIRIASQELKNEGLLVFQGTIPEAMRLQQRAVRQMLETRNDKGVLLPVDIRAVPAIVAPFNDYVAPKKHIGAGEVQTVIQVNLTVNQASGLDAPVMDVEYEEVTTEIVP